MILLTDEEIDIASGVYTSASNLPNFRKDIAKAQLRKVAEWFLDNSYETTDECDLSGDTIRAIKVKDLQALLEEIKE